MSAAKRVEQIAGHLNYPKGLLAGQTAIVTGSGQGIGAEAARLFAKEGAKVVVSDIDASKTTSFSDDWFTPLHSADPVMQKRQKKLLQQSSQKVVRQSLYLEICSMTTTSRNLSRRLQISAKERFTSL